MAGSLSRYLLKNVKKAEENWLAPIDRTGHLLVLRGCIALLAGPQFLWSHSVSFTLGYFDSDKLWKVRRRTVFGHMLVLVESQCFPKLDTPGSKFRLVNTNLAGAEIHRPLNLGFSISHIVF